MSSVHPHQFFHCVGHQFFLVSYNHNCFIAATVIGIFGYHTTTSGLSLHGLSVFWVPYNHPGFIIATVVNFFLYHAITLVLSLQRSSIFKIKQPYWFYHCNRCRFFQYHAINLVLILPQSLTFRALYNRIAFLNSTVIILLSKIEPHWILHSNTHRFLKTIHAHWFYHSDDHHYLVHYNLIEFITAALIDFFSDMQPLVFFTA